MNYLPDGGVWRGNKLGYEIGYNYPGVLIGFEVQVVRVDDWLFNMILEQRGMIFRPLMVTNQPTGYLLKPNACLDIGISIHACMWPIYLIAQSRELLIWGPLQHELVWQTSIREEH